MAASKQKSASKQQPCSIPDNKDLYLPPLIPDDSSEDAIFHVKLKSGLLAGVIDNAMSTDIRKDLFFVHFDDDNDGRMEIRGDNYEFSQQKFRPDGNNAKMSSMTSFKENIQVTGMVDATLQVDARPAKHKTPKPVPRRRAPRSPTNASKRTAKELAESAASAKPAAPKRARISDAAANARAPLLRSTPSPHLSPGAAPRQSSLTHGFSKSRSVTPPGGMAPRSATNGNGRMRPSPGPSPAQSSAPSSPGPDGNLRPRSGNGKELRVNIIHILALGDITEAKLRSRLFETGPDRDAEAVLRKTLAEVATPGKTGYSLLEDKWREVSEAFGAYSPMERARVRKAVTERDRAAAAKKKTTLRSRPAAKPVPKSEPRAAAKAEARAPKAEPRVPKSEPRAKADARVPKSEPRRSETRGNRGGAMEVRMVSRDSSDEEMAAALDAFDNRLRKSGPIRSESEDEEVRKFWTPLHALYSEVNRRLEKVQAEVQELWNSFEKAGSGSIKKELERKIGILYTKHVHMHKEYVQYLPKLHKEVKKTLERLEEWVEYNKDESS